MNIDSYRGKAVFVTFIYTHCPDVCPLITSNLRVALNLMGKKASKAQVIAVSVDPRGDTRQDGGEVPRRARDDRADAVPDRLPEANWRRSGRRGGWAPNARSGHPDLVEHTGIVYGITGSGQRLAVYAANFAPKDVAHDAPILAAQ